MAQYRALHVKITQSFDVNEMPDDFTRLMWTILPLALDREGRGIYNSSWLRSKLFPLREDLSSSQIMAAMDWFIDHNMAIKYEIDNRFYFYVPSFKKYQRGLEKEAASVLPDPVEQSLPALTEVTPELGESKGRVTPELGESMSLSNGTELNLTQTQTEQNVNSRKPREKEPPAAAPALSQQFFDPAWPISVFSRVTQMPGIPGSDLPRVMDALESLRPRFSTEVEMVDYLKPYFDGWIKRRTKDGRVYSKSNCAWLYDMALAGDAIPSPNKHPPRERPDPNCPKCGGVGMLASNNNDIHSDGFGKLVKCDCVRVVEEVKT